MVLDPQDESSPDPEIASDERFDDDVPRVRSLSEDEAGDINAGEVDDARHLASSAEDTVLLPDAEEDDERESDIAAVGARDTSTSQAWDRDWSPQRLAAELKHVEEEIRELLEGRDPKRKRKFTGTRRWLELQEDLIQLHYTEKYDQPTLARIQQLVRRRHSLFQQLRFLSGTRPTWNT